VIEGLDRLTQLEDLTLFNNRIQHLENMDTLSKLHVFSIGNNDLKELDNVCYLLLLVICFYISLLVISAADFSVQLNEIFQFNDKSQRKLNTKIPHGYKNKNMNYLKYQYKIISI